MSSACWLSDRDATLARARRLAPLDLAGALALVDGVLAEAPDDLEALRAKADVLGEAGDEAAARALRCYDGALAALAARGATSGADLEAARRGRAAVLARS